MRELLNGAFAPITFSVGFLEKDIEEIHDAHLKWNERNHVTVRVDRISGSLPEMLTHLTPLTAPLRRQMWVITKSGWTAYFDNSVTGPDPRTPISYLSEQLQCRGLLAAYQPHTLHSDFGRGKGTYGAVMFEMYGPGGDLLNCIRVVCVAWDGRWTFNLFGPVQPFEEEDRYSARRLKNRFTPEMVERYCQALGVRLFDDDFYCGPAVMLSTLDQWQNGWRELTLAEAWENIGR
jgi:hypothetical protein